MTEKQLRDMGKASERAKDHAGDPPSQSRRGYMDHITWSINHDAFLIGYNQAEIDLSTENSQLKEALKEIVCESGKIIQKAKNVNKEFDAWIYIDDLENSISKVNQLLK